MSKIIDMPFFVGKMPTYSLKEFDLFHSLRNGLPALTIPGVVGLEKKLPSIPTALLSNILCFIESIINSIIDFVWGILGLGSVLPPPHIKLCRDSNNNANTNDLIDLLNGAFEDPAKADNGPQDPSYNFIFNIKTSDGKDLRSLNREELNAFIEENKDIQIDFNL